MEENISICDKICDCFELGSDVKKPILHGDDENDISMKTVLNIGNRKLPTSVFFSKDDEWAIFSVNLSMNCLQGCEQRLFSYCARIYESSEQYVQGLFQLDDENALHFNFSISVDALVQQGNLLQFVLIQSKELLNKFYPVLQKLCSGRLLNSEELRMADEHSDDPDDNDLHPIEKSDLTDICEQFVWEAADEYSEEPMHYSAQKDIFSSDLHQICRDQTLTLRTFIKDGRGVVVSLTLPFAKIPGTDLVMQYGFQKIYQSKSWHQGVFCIDENGQISLRMGITAKAVLQEPMLLWGLMKDGIDLLKVFYPMIECLAQGRLLPDDWSEPYFYETHYLEEDMRRLLAEREKDEEEEEPEKCYELAWDPDNFSNFVKDPEEQEEPEDFEKAEEEWEEFSAEFNEKDEESEESEFDPDAKSLKDLFLTEEEQDAVIGEMLLQNSWESD